MPISAYRDGFGNWCSRIVAPAGQDRISTDAVVRDSGKPDPVVPRPGSTRWRICRTKLWCSCWPAATARPICCSDIAWKLFGGHRPGWARVQAICDFVHHHITFGYSTPAPPGRHGRPSRAAGVCRDFAHLAIAFCRCMNIPARYCTGYLGDIGVPPPTAPMDFAGWFEAYLGGQLVHLRRAQQYAAHRPILIARGRDAADVAISTTSARTR